MNIHFCLTVHCWHGIHTPTPTEEKIENIVCHHFIFLFLFQNQNIYKTQVVEVSPSISSSVHLFFIYCWQIVDLHHLSFFPPLSSERAIKEKMGLFEGLQCLGGGDWGWLFLGDGGTGCVPGWKQRSWLCFKTALSDALIDVTVYLYYKIP